jgi:hypothetical protein
VRLLNGSTPLVAGLLGFAGLLSLQASVIGHNTPAMTLTRARVMQLPAAKRGPWLAYLERSAAQMRADKAGLAAERVGMKELPPLPKQGFSARSIPLHRDAEFYKSDEAKHIGDVIVSFQTPGGGWSKNLDMSGEPRQPGQLYATANLAPVEGQADDFDKPLDPAWHYISTLDNDATNTELHFLAELSAALPGKDGDKYRAAALKGFEYLLRAQYPNGGWPQVWPLEGGYHDAITFNDDAVTESAEVLTAVAKGERVTSEPEAMDPEMVAAMKRMGRDVPEQHAVAEDYTFVPAALRARAKLAVAKALECILATQLRVPAEDGKGTVLAVWAQQNDSLTLAPVSARNYEMPALSSGESASVMLYLMELPKPSAAVVRSIDAAAAWFEAHKIMGFVYSGGRNTPGGRALHATPGAGPIWARYYSLTTGKPIFGDRDKTIHDDVAELSLERRNGYGWYGAEPAKALREYAEWRKAGNRKRKHAA